MVQLLTMAKYHSFFIAGSVHLLSLIVLAGDHMQSAQSKVVSVEGFFCFSAYFYSRYQRIRRIHRRRGTSPEPPSEEGHDLTAV